MRAVLGLMLAFTGTGCHRVSPADLVYQHGAIYPRASDPTPVEALAVADGLVVFAGKERAAQRYIGPDTEVVNLRRRAVLPGFVDAHSHPIWSGTELQDVDLFEATTLDGLYDAVAEGAAANPEAPWVRGTGWDVSLFDGQLHRSDLDAVVSDRPVYLSSADGHSAFVNSLALEAAGIDADSPDPEGGIIEREEDGSPSGVLRETAAEAVQALLPDYDEAQVARGLAMALAELSSYGLTSVIDAAAEEWMLQGYAAAEAQGALTARFYAAVPIDPALGPDQLGEVQRLRDSYAGPHLSVNAVKFYLDGVIESETAWMLEPYEDGSNGAPLFTDAGLQASAIAYDAAGFQLHAHAIGDAATRQMLDAVEAVSRTNGPGDRRALLAHLEVIDPADILRFGELEVYADFQPLWAFPDPYIVELTLPFIGEARGRWLYPMGSVRDAGGTLVAGSDWSVSTMNPWEAIEVAVLRQDPDDAEGAVLNEEERLALPDILAAYTEKGAAAIFAEDELGSLEVGYRADIVVLDRDPYTTPAAELSEIKVLRTLMDGRVIYDAGVLSEAAVTRPFED